MRRRARVRVPRGDEGGFTLVEMIVTLVVMGIVIVPLALGMKQFMSTAPQASARNRIATDVSRAATIFHDDSAQAQTTSNEMLSGSDAVKAAGGTGSWKCPVAGLANGDPALGHFLASFTWTDMTQAATPLPIYRRIWSINLTPNAAGSKLYQVSLTTVLARSTDGTLNFPAFTSWIAVTNLIVPKDGVYCRAKNAGLGIDDQVAKVTTSAPVAGTEQSIRIELDFVDNKGNAIPPIFLEGDTRVTST